MKNSILLIDFINRVKEHGASIHDAVIESGKARRRAILLASLTTFVALFPPAFEIVGEEPYLAPMATSMFWGTLFSTLLALSSVPCLYLIAEDIRSRFLPTPGDTK